MTKQIKEKIMKSFDEKFMEYARENDNDFMDADTTGISVKEFISSAIDEAVWESNKEMFNRIWDKSFGKTKDDVEGVMLLIRELNQIRNEITNSNKRA